MKLLKVDYFKVDFGKEGKAYTFTRIPIPETCTVSCNISCYVFVRTHQMRQLRVMSNRKSIDEVKNDALGKHLLTTPAAINQFFLLTTITSTMHLIINTTFTH